jgi:hypothetical protein
MERRKATPGKPRTTIVSRGRHAYVEAERDAEVLRFIGRFRFVTDELLGGKFGVSRQQMNLRLRRLAAAGLVQRTASPAQPALTMLTPHGARAVGLPARRAARTDAQRDHELALVWLVIQLERAGNVDVRTERECRELEAAEVARYSVPVAQTGRQADLRWPDIVLVSGSRRTALEVELSAKGRKRLQAIIDGYATADAFDEVMFLAIDACVARRLAECVADAVRPPRRWAQSEASPTLRVAPWPALHAAEQHAVAEAVSRAPLPRRG